MSPAVESQSTNAHVQAMAINCTTLHEKTLRNDSQCLRLPACSDLIRITIQNKQRCQGNVTLTMFKSDDSGQSGGSEMQHVPRKAMST
jgi:secreted trypsin-like serine protease